MKDVESLFCDFVNFVYALTKGPYFINTVHYLLNIYVSSVSGITCIEFIVIKKLLS